MSKLPERLKRQLASRGVKNAKGVAESLLKKRGHMDADGNLTEAGKKRQSLGNDGRAKDRAAKRSGGSPKDYTYNAKTNRAKKKKDK
jgi:hypothetical protein